MGDVPEEVRRLVEERQTARSGRDFAAADALRKRVRAMGFEIEDSPQGPWIRPLEKATEGLARLAPGRVESVLDRPATFEFSVQWVVQGWPEDAVRGIEAFRRNEGEHAVQYVVVDAARTDPGLWPGDVEVVALDGDHGWATGRNCGLKRAAGGIVVVADGSVEPTGDVLGPLSAALADPGVGVAGPFGLITEDLHHFHESEGPEVDAIEGYLMAFRREVVAEAGLFDQKFRYYRTADIELSFRIKDRGLKAVVVPVSLRRHEHRMWTSTPQEERERLSKRNFYRFLDRWRGRLDLCVGGGDPPEH